MGVLNSFLSHLSRALRILLFDGTLNTLKSERVFNQS